MGENHATSCGWVDGKCSRCGRTQPDRHDSSRCPGLPPDAREEAERRWPMPNGYGEYSLSNHDQRAGFVAGAEWQGAQQSEPVGNREKRDLADVLMSSAIYRGLNIARGEITDADRGTKSYKDCEETAATILKWQSELSGNPGQLPQQSETRITDEMVEAAEAAWEAAYDDHRSDANCMRAALVAALEGEQQ